MRSAEDYRALADEVLVFHAPPRRSEVNGLGDFALGVFVFDDESADEFLREMADEFLHEVGHLLKVGEGPVGFEHGKFRIVTGGNPFIPEISIDLKHPLKPTYD